MGESASVAFARPSISLAYLASWRFSTHTKQRAGPLGSVELGAIDADVSDNFSHLLSGNSRTLYIAPSKPVTHQELIAQLKIRHLAETYTA